MSKFKCRLCLEESDKGVEIFKEDFPRMIELLTGLKVDPNDGLPKTACKQCQKEVKLAMLTRYQIIHSYKILLDEIGSNRIENSYVNLLSKELKFEDPLSNYLNIQNSNLKNNLSASNTLSPTNCDNTNIYCISTNVNETSAICKSKYSSEESTKSDLDFESDNSDFKEDEHIDDGDEQDIDNNDEENSICETSEHSDENFEVKDGDYLLDNAENIIKAAVRNPSQKDEQEFKKLINKLQGKDSRMGKIRFSRKKESKKTLPQEKIQFKKKGLHNPYQVKIESLLNNIKPEHIDFLKTLGKKDRVACPICAREMYGMNMKNHLITHNYDPVICTTCGKTSKNAQALQDHINYYHKTTPDRFVCDKCGRGFRVKCALDKHEKKEHGSGEKEFECTICGKRFFEKMHLKNHVDITHNKIRPFKCEHCGKDFGRRTQFVTHQLVHTKENRYHCQVCGKGFKIKQTMQTHLKGVHGIEEQKTIFCTICSKGFSTPQGLRAHINSRVHGLEKCEHCSEYITLEYKNIHLKDMHGLEVENPFS